MPYANSLTRDDVFAAADEIFASGKSPTQASIRSKLGRGSFSTINKHLAEWRETRTDLEAINTSSQGMSEQELDLLQRVYGIIRSNVEVTVITEQVTLLERENQELRDRQANYDAIAAELAGLRFAYQETLNRLDQVTRESEQLRQKLETPIKQEPEKDKLPTKTSTRKPRSKKLEGSQLNLVPTSDQETKPTS